MSDKDPGENQKLYLNRAGKKVEVNIEHLKKPHTLQPKEHPSKRCPLVLGGDHRPSVESKTKSTEEPHK
ncbi:LADA_0H08262g1_1 [Lachancea dasiensis]|uniref:LADA_0H08262g1_1 n=1 Tax=Lachancea dasiensis TaxID=1072105 RepID=A0A1G4K2P4_9SACH|nr:LADA_0H08262g1_1 [Lachancea dasiensis]